MSKSPRGLTTLERFNRNIFNSENGCLEWTGNLTESGYGRFAINPKKTVRAHRFSWEINNGAIPDGLCVLHKCDNRKCIKIDHLFIGTHLDNALDRERKNRGAAQKRKGSNHPLAKLSNEKAKSIRSLYSTGEYKIDFLSSLLCVSRTQIRRVINNEVWV